MLTVLYWFADVGTALFRMLHLFDLFVQDELHQCIMSLMQLHAVVSARGLLLCTHVCACVLCPRGFALYMIPRHKSLGFP